MAIDTDALLKDAQEDAERVRQAQNIDVPPGGVDAEGVEEDDLEPERPANRLAVAVALPTIAAALMVGGVYTGVMARVYAVVSGLLGIGLALAVGRMRRRPMLGTALIVVGLFAIGLLMVVPSGLGNVADIRTLAADAAKSREVLRPPVDLTPGWQAIIGWLMGIVGFVATWIAIVIKRPSIALLIPLPIAAIAGISVPESQQVASGIVVLVLFAIGLAVLSSETAVGDDGERPPLGYEVRKALKALPVLVVIVGLMFALSQANFLFPDPQIDPAQEPQKPKTVPLSEVEDRVLFEVEAKISGPWRIGGLDEYDGKDWRLPPFAQSTVKKVPRSGIVDPDLELGIRATFTVRGLGGAVLPALPNTAGIIAKGPQLSYDARNGNIRLVSGQVRPGLGYTVAAAPLPTVDQLKASDGQSIPSSVRRFVRIPDPPPAVVDLIARAPKSSKWEEFDYLRTWILENVTATGTGTPIAVPPERVDDMIGGSKKGSPYEIVAAQAMLARWIGIPSRIGYGFDGGEVVDEILHVRPRHGASFPEVYFPGFKWLPVIGTPKKAEPTVGADPNQQRVDPTVLPSDDISVQVFLPTIIPPPSVFGQQLAVIVAIAIGVFLLALLIWSTYPGLVKVRVRGRRRAAALEAGPRARIALAYAEWRDYCTDLGFRHPGDTPLMFLDRFVDDDEHIELAWLVTRTLWGDLQDEVTPEMATAAEELSRALRRRLGAVQPATVRAVAAVSRLSLRYPYAPGTDLTRRALERDEKERERATAGV